LGKPDIVELKKQIVQACKILDNENVLDELGHFSTRVSNTEHILINGQVSPARAKVEDIIMVDLDGRKIEGDLQPVYETPLHLRIYRKRKDVLAIAHTHSPMVVVLSTLGVKLRPLNNIGAAVFSEEIPMYDRYGLINSSKMADEIADLLSYHTSVTLKGHGNVVVGSSIEECCVSAIWIEKAATIQYQAMALGKPDYLSKEIVESTRISTTMHHKVIKRAWDYFVWRST
jgi:L-ribulose-5-phosphate 4-epimerase